MEDRGFRGLVGLEVVEVIGTFTTVG